MKIAAGNSTNNRKQCYTYLRKIDYKSAIQNERF